MKIDRQATLKRLGDFAVFEIENEEDGTKMRENLELLQDLIDSLKDETFSDEGIIRDFKRFGYYSKDVPVMVQE